MLKTKGLQKVYGDTVITYPDITFTGGRKYLIIGASGCGKSTYLNMLAGVVQPSSGVVEYRGTDYASLKAAELERLRVKDFGYIYQDFKLLDTLTVKDNIEILKLEKLLNRGVDEVLCELGLQDKANTRCRFLSGGEKQRVAIARALVKTPKVLLADEPTGSLNFEIGESVMQALCKASEGALLVAVSHDTRLTKYFDEVVDFSNINQIRKAV